MAVSLTIPGTPGRKPGHGKKVIHVITRMDMGGSAQNTIVSCIGLAELGYEIMLIHGPSQESQMTVRERRVVQRFFDKAFEAGVRIIVAQRLIRRLDVFNDLTTLFFLFKIFRREQPDIVHTHTSKAGIIGRWAAKLAGVKNILHTPHGHVFFGHFSQPLSKLFFIAEKITELITDRFVALTEGEKKDYIKLSLIRSEKISTIHSGVNIQSFSEAVINIEEKKGTEGIRKNIPVVGSVGWLMPIKGPMVLLNAMEKVWQTNPDVALIYVGKGFLEEELKTTTKAIGASDKVYFLGWREDVHDIIQLMDIVVLPSMNEGMGRVIVEAMAAAKPVIGSNVGGIPDLIEHGTNGLLFPPGDTDELAEAIKRLIADGQLRKTMGGRGKKFSLNFDISNMVEKINTLYQGLTI